MAFTGLDYYDIDELLTEEERLVRDTVRSFVSDEVAPIIGEHFERGTFPRQLVPRLAELGLLGASLEGYGCAGASETAYGLINQELERGDSGLRSFLSVHSSLVMYPVWQYGSEEQKQHWLPRLASGEAIGCFGLTEPDFGSNPAGMRTTARRDGKGYRLNGSKLWITNGTIADVALVWAKLDGEICGFLVPCDAPGFSARNVTGKWSLRASVTSELVFDECQVGPEALLPGGHGLRAAFGCLNHARTGIAWGAVGVMLACYDEALAYARERVQFSRPIAGYQLVQEKLATMVTEITKAQLLCVRLGRLKEAGKIRAQQISLAKRNNVYWAREIARTARDILGASGITLEYHSGRHMLNIEAVYTYEGTHDIHTLILGRDVTGISAID